MKLAARLMVEVLTDYAASGFTMQETADHAELSYTCVGTYARRYGIKFLRTGLSAPSERSEQMATLYKSGQTLEQIGAEFGVTRERVRQIITKHHGLTAKHGGATKLAKDRRKQTYAARDARSMKKWGCPWSQYVLLRDAGKPVRAYHSQKGNAGSRGIAWELTLWQWWTIWQESGHWNERGRGRGYAMCRKEDIGPYSVENVYIATGVENIQHYWEHSDRPRRVKGELSQEALERRRLHIRKYYYRRKFRKAGVPEEQIPAHVAAHCPGMSI